MPNISLDKFQLWVLPVLTLILGTFLPKLFAFIMQFKQVDRRNRKDVFDSVLEMSKNIAEEARLLREGLNEDIEKLKMEVDALKKENNELRKEINKADQEVKLEQIKNKQLSIEIDGLTKQVELIMNHGGSCNVTDCPIRVLKETKNS